MGNGYYGAIYNNSGTVAVLGGTLVGTKSLNRTDCGIYNKTGTVTIGENDNNVSTTNPSITGAKYGIFNESGTLYFYDGVITGEKGNSIYGIIKDIPENYDTEVSEDGDIEHITLTNSAPNVAKVDDNEFRNLKEAVEYCNKNSNGTTKTITMIKDYTLSTDNYEAVINSGTNVKLDLAGYTVEIKAQKGIKNNGELEIVSQTDENGKIYTKATGINNGNISAINNVGNIILTSGEISSVNSYVLGICNEGTGNVTINGGTIDTNSYGIKNIQNGTVKINSGILKSSSYSISNETSGLVEISGGTINGLSGIINKAEGTVRIIDGTIEVSGYDSRLITNEGTGKIEIIGGTVKTYGRYSRGIENNSTGEVIIQGGTVGEYPNTNMGSNQKTIVNKAGTLKITGGTIEVGESGDNAIYNESGNVEISNAKIKSNSYATATIENKTGTIKITSVEIETTTQYSANYPAIKNTETGSIEIQGGTITNTKGEGISVKKGEVKVLGGTIKSTTSQGIIVESSGTLTIGNNDDEVSTQIPEIVGSTYGVYNSGTFNFYDGKITGAKDQSLYGEITKIPDDYEIILNENEDTTQTAVLGKEVATAQIGQTVYNSLQLAIDAVEENKQEATKIEMLRSVTSIKEEPIGTIPQNKKIQLDLKGYILNSAKNNIAIENAGDLELINSTENIGKIKQSKAGNSSRFNYIINNTGKFKLTSGIINAAEGYTYGINNSEDGKIIIDGGEISGNIDGINTLGETVVNNGNIYGYSFAIKASNNANVTITNGTLTSNTNAVLNEGSGTVTISGGALNANTIVKNTSSGIINIKDNAMLSTSGSGKTAILNEGSGKVNFMGGTISMNTSGYCIDNKTTGKIVISGGFINISGYGGNYGRFIRNYQNGEILITGGTIDTTISNNNGDAIENHDNGIIKITRGKITTRSRVVYNMDSGNVEISGGIHNTLSDYSNAVYNSNYGKVYVKDNATIISIKDTIGTSGSSTTEITGGTIKSTNAGAIYCEQNGIVKIGIDDNKVNQVLPNIVGKTYGLYNASSSSYIYFYDGRVTGKTEKSTYGTITIPENYKISKSQNDDGTETATLSILGTNVSKASVNDIYYSSLQEAVNACGTSGEIIILNTLSISENITIKEGTNIIINTNGKTLTYVGNDTFITNNGTLTLTGTGTIKAQSGTLIGGSGKTTIEDTVNTN